MHFLIDANLPRFAAILVGTHGYEAVDARDVGLGNAEDSAIAFYAHQHGLCLITGDLGFSDIRTYPPGQYHGLVVLRFPADATSQHKLQLLEMFLQQEEL